MQIGMVAVIDMAEKVPVEEGSKEVRDADRNANTTQARLASQPKIKKGSEQLESFHGNH
jgi:hypothetical protein